MNHEQWSRFENTVDELGHELVTVSDLIKQAESVRLGKKVQAAVDGLKICAENIDDFKNHLYCIAEESRSEQADLESKTAGYEDALALLPDGSHLSVAEVDALKEHINTWRKEYGYTPNT